MTTVIETHDLSMHYRSPYGPQLAAIDRLSLVVAEGAALGLLGARGSGKTTLLRLLAGRLKPTGGAVYLNGVSLAQQPRYAARTVGMLDEMLAALYGRGEIWDTLLSNGRRSRRPRLALEESAEQLLRRINLWERRGEHIQLLTEGERRLLALACLRVAGMRILLLDEPADDLPAVERARLLAGIQQLSAGTTVVLATRWVPVASECSQRVAVLANGRLVGEIPAQVLSSRSNVERYEIRVGAHLNAAWYDWLERCSVTNLANGEAVISACFPDQAALHGLLARLQSLNIPLRAVSLCEPALADVLPLLARRQP